MITSEMILQTIVPSRRLRNRAKHRLPRVVRAFAGFCEVAGQIEHDGFQQRLQRIRADLEGLEEDLQTWQQWELRA